jgi:hypothetical protein
MTLGNAAVPKVRLIAWCLDSFSWRRPENNLGIAPGTQPGQGHPAFGGQPSRGGGDTSRGGLPRHASRTQQASDAARGQLK